MLIVLVVIVSISICGTDSSFVTSITSNDLTQISEMIENDIDRSSQNETEDGRFKIVCYFTNWSFYRQGIGKFLPENIDANLCTHIIYAFAELDPDTLILKVYDSWVDIDNKFYERVTAFRQKGIKVLIAIGGWNDSIGEKYSRLLLNKNARKNFVTNSISFMQMHNFDGLDLDLEYPVCWQGNCQSSRIDEREGFTELVKELSDAFKSHGLLLSAAVSASQKIIDAAYDVPNLVQYLDWISMMTYDYHGSWDGQTGHNAPLHPISPSDNFNADFTTQYWIQSGASPAKLVMGVPSYGRTFTLADPQKNGLNAPSNGPGDAGPFTRAGGMLSIYEIGDKLKDGWNIVQDPKKRIGPYAFKNNQWISYDDIESIQTKAKFIRELNLGGGMIWALDLDDFSGECGFGKYPLLTALKVTLSGQKIGNKS